MENAEENDKNKKKVLIPCGKINKSLLYIILMSVFQVLNQYIYGFIYIECFYKMNIYQVLYNAIIDQDKTDFLHHRVFDPLFSYIGVIILSLFIPKEKNKKNKSEGDEENELNNIKESRLSLKLIHTGFSNYLKSKRGIIFFVLILILWVA